MVVTVLSITTEVTIVHSLGCGAPPDKLQACWTYKSHQCPPHTPPWRRDRTHSQPPPSSPPAPLLRRRAAIVATDAGLFGQRRWRRDKGRVAGLIREPRVAGAADTLHTQMLCGGKVAWGDGVWLGEGIGGWGMGQGEGWRRSGLFRPERPDWVGMCWFGLSCCLPMSPDAPDIPCLEGRFRKRERERELYRIFAARKVTT